MNREAIISVLASLKDSLQPQGIESLYLFGSRARNEAGAKSDIDVAFVVSSEMEERFSLLDQARIRRQLGDLMIQEVDFVELAALRPRIAQAVEKDLIQIF
jgi:predicted nucleotidyltransferase